MGSSVFHGGFSTFVAISVLAPAKTYIFVIFYRMWFGMILFGMANGFLLLPVILSFIGPTQVFIDPTEEKGEELVLEMCENMKSDTEKAVIEEKD